MSTNNITPNHYPESFTTWIPPLDPPYHLHQTYDPAKFRPAQRGSEAPSTPQTPFAQLVKDIHDMAVRYNAALMPCKLDTHSDPQNSPATQHYRRVQAEFEALIEQTPGEILVEPVLSSGYIIDIRIIADQRPDSDRAGIRNAHSSSYISLYPCEC